jgi:hypothetical protein
MGNKISTFFAENNMGRAEVYHDHAAHYIEYYDQNGNMFHTEQFPGRSIHYVEDAAENWTLGIKQLNG